MNSAKSNLSSQNILTKGLPENESEELKVLATEVLHPQNEQDRKKIRESYRKFNDEIIELREVLVNPEDEDDLLTQKVIQVDQMFTEVQMTREGALDSASLVNLSEFGKTKAQALKTNFKTFNPIEFCEQVKIAIAGDASTSISGNQWINLGKAVTPFFKRAPVLKFMCGTFEKGEVVLKQNRRQPREKETENLEKASKPTQLSSFEETDRGELTTAQVEHLLKTLWDIYEKNENTPVCYFEFITHPTSYGKTVENMFYVSFLVRDGHARIFLDSEELPVIEPIQKEVMEKGRRTQEQPKKSSQMIIALTPAQWEEIVKTFNIEVPIIKDLKPPR